MHRSENLARSASVFAALGDETRLRLVVHLRQGPASVTRLTEGFAISRQAITKHLRVMETAGIAHCSQRGRESVWEVDEDGLTDAREFLMKMISREWDQRLERLAAHVQA
jgi:DNA-binding transcriptional ArsR family regulator